MIKINEAIIVEGKYDKIKLETLVDAPIVTTDGFSIFNNKEKMRFIRMLAKKRGIIILTDSDSAGFLIRNKLCGSIPTEQIKNVYIPQLSGKEKRKATASKEGFLGVEGVNSDTIKQAFERAGIIGDESADESQKPCRPITKADLFELGLSGSENSAVMRQKLFSKLDFPSHMSANALITALNIFVTYDELAELCKNL